MSYDGNITWLTQGMYVSKCEIDVKYYPLDAQNCSLKFASWSQEVTKVHFLQIFKKQNFIIKMNLTLGTEISQKDILSLYTVNKEFELKEFYGARHETPWVLSAP